MVKVFVGLFVIWSIATSLMPAVPNYTELRDNGMQKKAAEISSVAWDAVKKDPEKKLSKKLQALEDAKIAGHITEEEYASLRQNLLDNFTTLQ